MDVIEGYYKPVSEAGLSVIYEDEAILILDKPNGLLSVPGNGGDKQDSLALRAQLEYPDARIVHRLDMATSGIMIMARGAEVHRIVSKAFADRKIGKRYIAVVNGCLQQVAGIVDVPLSRDWPNRPRQKVDYENGKASITHYRVLKYNENDNSTRLELTPETGRSHQLRLHMKSIGHAIIGDRLYGDEQAREKSPRLLLHALALRFTHPTLNKEVSFRCDVPF